MKIANKKILFYSLFFFGLFLLLSFKLIRIPPGINIDEASIGYNASLISKSLHDENNRFLPIFILTLNGKDWKQPVKIYFTAFLFKVFGVSFFNLRLTSVIFALVSCFIFYKFLRLFFSEIIGLIGLLLFITSPSMLLQSHLALENIDLIPFVLLWLYFLSSFVLRPRNYKLLLSGFFLGISFYAYKGMHAIVPVYLCLTIIYLLYLKYCQKTVKLSSVFFFLLGTAPFILPLKWIQTCYAGAVFDPVVVRAPSFFDAMEVYLSSFDFSFLFLKGDKMLIHSTGRHGLFLLPNIILFFLGFLQLSKEKKPIFYFVFISLLMTPFLYVTVGSIYRASRLMAYIPLASFIFILGFKNLLENKNKVLKIICITLISVSLLAHYGDFIFYYLNAYPKTISQDFSPNFDEAMRDLSRFSVSKRKLSFIELNLYNENKAAVDFFNEVNFSTGRLRVWTREKERFPQDGIVLTGIGGSGKIKTIKEIESLESGQKTLYLVEED